MPSYCVLWNCTSTSLHVPPMEEEIVLALSVEDPLQCPVLKTSHPSHPNVEFSSHIKSIRVFENTHVGIPFQLFQLSPLELKSKKSLLLTLLLKIEYGGWTLNWNRAAFLYLFTWFVHLLSVCDDLVYHHRCLIRYGGECVCCKQKICSGGSCFVGRNPIMLHLWY